MTSSNGNIFRATGHLCGEFTSHRWIPRTKASDTELWCFHWSAPALTFEKTIVSWWFETPLGPLWRHSNANMAQCMYLFEFLWNCPGLYLCNVVLFSLCLIWACRRAITCQFWYTRGVDFAERISRKPLHGFPQSLMKMPILLIVKRYSHLPMCHSLSCPWAKYINQIMARCRTYISKTAAPVSAKLGYASA